MAADETTLPTLSRSDVERLVSVEKDVKYLRLRVDESISEQKKTNANLAQLNQAHAVALDRERTHNRYWSFAVGIVGGFLSNLFSPH